MVEKRVQQIISNGIPKEQVGEFIIYGTPDDVLKQIELLEEVGIQYLIVDLEPYRELEALEVFGNSIVKKLSRTAKATH
jgi:alkanesulfonate monooxygenase SsuD/methylene tetrahydromethanopterin reductase-like flavin-dependent oxidoreductase (luciferase family)